MTQIGEEKPGKEIGYKTGAIYQFAACPHCGKGRWVVRSEVKENRLCCKCAANTPEQKALRSKQFKGRIISEETRQKLRTYTGEKASNWKGGICHTGAGYILVKLQPSDFFYPMATKKDYVMEHRLVMAKHLGRCLQSWELVHHKGKKYSGIENKSDNRIDNLELDAGIGEHSANHAKGYRDGYLKGYNDGRDKRIKELEKQIGKLGIKKVLVGD